MSYSQARDIRKKSLVSLLTDELMKDDTTIGGSIKSALSEKSKATMKGIKQRFDPMNIVKFMTGGSTLASTMFGKMTGRNEEDMRFFAGKDKATPVGSKATKVGAVEGGSDEGLIAVLSQIYSLLKSTHENEVTKRELENNKMEEREYENERRHKELLKALGVITGDEPTATKDSPEPGMGLMDIVTSIVSAFGGLSSIVSVGKFFLGGLGSALMTGMAAFGPLVAMYVITKWAENASIFDENGNMTTTGKVLDAANKTLGGKGLKPESQMSSLEQLDKDTQVGWWESKSKKVKKIEGDIERGVTYTKEEAAVIKKNLNIDVPITKESTPTSETTPATTNTPASTPTRAPTTPKVIPDTVATVSSKVNSAINENNNLQLAEKTTSTSTTDIQKQKTVNVEMAQQAYRGPMPSVRNVEDTFQRMIYNSTRVA